MGFISFKKKKHVIFVSICMITCFILYQLYFFAAITSQTSSPLEIVPILNTNELEDINIGKVVAVRSSNDKFVNDHGMLRGVSRQDLHKYRPDSNNQFKCINTDQYIPFDYVNDDYCDCDDSSDEPSTNACPNGVFVCESSSRKSSQVPSGRVNDGICDCCDGSDEWLSRRVLSKSSPHSLNGIYLSKCSYICSAE